MAGGKWTTLDSLDPSQRSGFYINFVADAVAGVQAGAQGLGLLLGDVVQVQVINDQCSDERVGEVVVGTLVAWTFRF